MLGEVVGTLGFGVGLAGRALELGLALVELALGLGAGVEGSAAGGAGVEQPTTRAAVIPVRTVTTVAPDFETLNTPEPFSLSLLDTNGPVRTFPCACSLAGSLVTGR